MAGHAAVVAPVAEPDFDGPVSEPAAGSSVAGCVRDARALETDLHGTGLETDPWLDMLVWWPQLLSLISTVRCRSLLLVLRLLVVSGRHAGVVAPAAEPDFDGAESEPAAGSSIAGCVRDARALETDLHGTGLETDPWLDMLVWWPKLLSLISTVWSRSLLLVLRLLVVSGVLV